MNLVVFIFILIACGIVARLLFGLGIFLCWELIKMFMKGGSTAGSSEELAEKFFADQFTLPKAAPKGLILGLALAFPCYFWGLWATFCVATTASFIQKPEVSWHWLYWICGFVICTASVCKIDPKTLKPFLPIEQMHAKAVFVGTAGEASHLPAVGAFLLFAFVPSLAGWPYGWFLTLTGLSQYMNG
jgi:hypothetical protein